MDIVNDTNTEQPADKTLYTLLNKDVELCGKYFDVVPDGNLYTNDDTPIFAVRMRPMGINYIMNSYKQKYNFETSVLTYKINTNQYTLYSDNSAQMYLTQRELLIKYFDFYKLKNNEWKGVIIVVVNKDDRMIHAIPYLYGLVNDRKKIIFLDPFFAPDMGSGCIIGADFFYREYNGEIDCYCHGETIQADHHSCGIIACDFVKNCLKNKAKLTNKIMQNVIMKTDVYNYSNGTISKVYVFDLPAELKKFAQVKTDTLCQNVVERSENDETKQKTRNWFSNHMRTLIYRRDPEPYNPTGNLIPEQDGYKKNINTSLLEKGHQYAGKIVKDLHQNTQYNSKYWLSVIREQKNTNVLKTMLNITKKIVGK